MNDPRTAQIDTTRHDLFRWSRSKSAAIQQCAENICWLLEKFDADSPDVRRSLMQQIHILRWQLDNPR